ncbi:MAG: hypothetical protein JO002_05295 [Burkholderiaceae bacterium]|nr:hypothetical protein [Burkholderiaceae bacterium]
MKRSSGSSPPAWQLLPGTLHDVEAVRRKCRRLVLRRAALSAGLSAVPIPGLDVVSDLGLMAKAIEEINTEFGLTPEQIARLKPEMRLVIYQMTVGVGGMMVGKLITREVVAHMLHKTGFKALAKQAAKVVPLAGQIAAASIGFAAFRSVANRHIDACASVAAAALRAA